MAAPSLKLYAAPGACSIVPQILLHYAGLQYTPNGISFEKPGDLFTKNPKGQVPVLLWDDEMYTELPAIAHAINVLQPKAKIFGEGPKQFVRVCEWLNFLTVLHAQAWAAYIRPGRFTDEPEAEAGVRRAAANKLRERYAHIESHLSSDGWAVGSSEMTAADAFLFAISKWAGGRGNTDVEKDFPKWAALAKRVEGIDAAKVALAEERSIAEELAK